MDKKKLIETFVFLLLFIILCSGIVRIWTGSETLLEYAGKNPAPSYEDRGPEPVDSVSQNRSTSTQDGSTSVQDGNRNEEETQQESEEFTMNEHPERVEFQPGFYYEPLSEGVKERITGISYPEDCTVPYEDLRYVSVLYFNFKGNEKTGELICNKAIAQDMVEIFYELHKQEYEIEQIHLIDEYGGDDILSMKDNNTSCFNYRVVDGTDHLSKHALGLAIDINPFFNPYVRFNADGTTYISPEGSEAYADRSKSFAYKIDENDLCYQLFTEHGFIWGGHWNSMKDYQHFQKAID